MFSPNNFRCSSILLFLSLVLISNSACAAIDNAGILDNVLGRYQSAASTWSAIITSKASWLFWTLATISMVWTFGMMALRKADLGEFFAEFVRFTIFTGFFWWLLSNGPYFAASIVNSLRQISAEATGLGNQLAPSGIVDIGFDIFFKVLDQSTVWSPVDSACGILISLIILIVFALIGVNVLLLLVSSWILIYAGVFFLGFGGSRWTSDTAIGYFKTVLNVAAQFFAMVLLIGIGKSFVDQYYASMSAGISLKELSVMLVVAAILLALVKTIPPQIGSLAGGNTSALGNGFGAGAVMGAAVMGAAAAASAGATLAASATSMGGGTQALMAAFSKANASENLGSSGITTSMAASVSNTGNGGHHNSSGNEGPLAAAMGDAETSPAPKTANTSFESGTSFGNDFTNSIGPSNESSAEENLNSQAGSGNTVSSNSGPSKSGNAPGEQSARISGAAIGATAAKAGRIALGTAANLAQGSWDVAKVKANKIKGSAADRISQTTGGKIAAAIKARSELPESMQNPVSTDDAANVPAGTNEPVDIESEVAAFRDRNPDHS